MRRTSWRSTRRARAGLTTLVAAAALLGCADEALLAPPSAPSAARTAAPASDSIRNRYIVLFRDDVGAPGDLANKLVAKHGGTAFHVYEKVVKGFAVANLPEPAVAALRSNPLVRSIEPDGLGAQSGVQSLPLTNFTYRTSRLWALDRIDEINDIFDGQYRYPTCGSGVHIYILDTGIRGGHVEFSGRMGPGVTTLSFSSGASPTIDQDGHGTQVAGAAAATTYGVAKCAILHPVRINDNGDAYYSDMIAGLDWVARYRQNPAVANLSYETNDFGVRDALERTIGSGVTVVKSAGNAGVDAYQDRGNRAAGLIVVGAVARDDYRSQFGSGSSNYGSLLTVFAPGSEVFTTDKDSDVDTATVYGTSFSSPIVAGVAAMVLQLEPGATPGRVRDVIVSSASRDQVMNAGAGSPNRLVYTGLNGVVIYGATRIYSNAVERTETYSAVTSNSAGPFTYQWEASIDGGPYTVVSTSGSTYSRTFYEGDEYNLGLRVTVTGPDGSLSNTLAVTITAPVSTCGVVKQPVVSGGTKVGVNIVGC